MTTQQILLILLIHVFKAIAPVTVLVSAMCAKKGSNEKTTRSEKQVHVLQLKPDSITATKKSVKQQAKSSKKAVMPKLEKKNPPTVVVVANPDGHKSIEEAVAEGLILDPAPFKIEGNLDARPPKHPKFGDELQRIIENPHSSSSETSVSSCSDECNERKRCLSSTNAQRLTHKNQSYHHRFQMVGGCCVCADDNGWVDNPLIYCDGENCEVAVHQGCYGIQEVPEGEWFCAKCTKAAGMLPGSINDETFCCQLCPFDHGALKRTDRKDGWAHVICALYIPEVRFGNVHSMEPVILSDVPLDKFQKVCYICKEADRPNDAKKGACMTCNIHKCKKSFHVTCAQRQGLLCEEGAVSRNVKYCGYCEPHLAIAKDDPAIKIIPACPPILQKLKAPEKHKKNAPTPTVLLTPPPPLPPVPKVTPMLADPLPIRPPPNQVNGISSTVEERTSGIFAPPTTFSPPLTTSSRSSVAPDPIVEKPKNSFSSGPLIPSTAQSTATTSSEKAAMANGSTLPSSSAETTVGSHCLQQLHIQSAAAAAAAGIAPQNDLNGYPGPRELSSFMHEIPARNTTSVASLLPPNAADFHLNGSGDEEKTVKAVLTAPLAKAKRMRDSKNDHLVDKTNKRPRANGGTRDRVADRTAAERRAAVAQSQPSTSTNGVVTAPPVPNPVEPMLNLTIPPPTHQSNGVAPPNIPPSQIPGPSTSNEAPVNGVSPSQLPHRLNTTPSFMEQLLERQWDQGSTLFISNASFDVAQLMSCLFQLKSENNRLEENLSVLRKRRDHLFALNARLAEVNTLDLARKREASLPDLPLVPKTEIHKQEHVPTSVPLPANHSSVLFEDAKPPKSHKKATVHQTPIAHPVPLTTSAVLPSSTPSAMSSANIQSARATPSTAGVPLAANPIMTAVTAANELAALSPDRVANHTQAILSMSRFMQPGMDANVAAQLQMLSTLQQGMNQSNLFSRMLTNPTMAGLASMLNGGLQQNAVVAQQQQHPLPTIPSTSATPNGK
ncbi:hypothetical protein L5515_004899 [Caenorhabditis briggsae]|uniref:Protein CBR-ZFP-1 n=1 Tax=Caenorhabditis briggsae TaxID=6238 RepID=A0AAE9EP37_CAEBR|nr:hypothetical protein L5515_004899 [Caenorhabditis briggsae]